jgi:hypothetical protein
MSSTWVRYLNPWKFRRDQAQQRVAALRQRDGDKCSRCRRPLRFDLPDGHDLAARCEPVRPGAETDLANLCLCHTRCHAGMVDHTPEVVERMRRKNEAELFAKSRRRKRKAA